MNLCYFRVIIFIKIFIFGIYKSCQIKVINNSVSSEVKASDFEGIEKAFEYREKEGQIVADADMQRNILELSEEELKVFGFLLQYKVTDQKERITNINTSSLANIKLNELQNLSETDKTKAGDDYFWDLLFYHLKLKCYIVIELKAVEFQPEFARKIEFLFICCR